MTSLPIIQPILTLAIFGLDHHHCRGKHGRLCGFFKNGWNERLKAGLATGRTRRKLKFGLPYKGFKMSEKSVKRVKLEDAKERDQFYAVAKKYWEKIPPTIDGMLGGFGCISNIDIQGSLKFLKPFLVAKKKCTGHHRALDCGSGIGRVSKHLLLPLFDYVDLLDQNQTFLDESVDYINEDNKRVENRLCMGLQDFTSEAGRYDVIWCQWVLMQLRDDDVVEFFRRSKTALSKNGLLILKENITSSGEIEIDETDSSVARSLKLLRLLIHKAGFQVVKEQRQQKFPKELYEVRMFACRVKNPI